MCTAGWLPTWPFKTIGVRAIMPPLPCSCLGIMVWRRGGSGRKVTGVFSLFLLPLGRPDWPCGAFVFRGCVFLWLVACVATFSASVRTIGSTMVGYERRCWVLINDKGKKDSPGTGLPYKDDKKRANS